MDHNFDFQKFRGLCEEAGFEGTNYLDEVFEKWPVNTTLGDLVVLHSVVAVDLGSDIADRILDASIIKK